MTMMMIVMMMTTTTTMMVMMMMMMMKTKIMKTLLLMLLTTSKTPKHYSKYSVNLTCRNEMSIHESININQYQSISININRSIDWIEVIVNAINLQNEIKIKIVLN